MRLKSCGEEFYPLFDLWSQQSANYGNTKEQWATLKPDGKITFGSLAHWAKEDSANVAPTVAPDFDVDKFFGLLDATTLNDTEFPITYLVEDVLVENQPMIFGGGSKTLKTSIMLDLAISLATEKHFLERFKVNQKCKCVFISGESGLPTIKETALRICKSKDVDLGDLKSDLQFAERLPRIDNDTELAYLRQLLVKHKFQGAVS